MIKDFLQSVLGDNSGYLKIAGGHKQKKIWHLRSLKYPEDLEQIETQINKWVEQGLNTYFSPHLFSQAKPRREYALPSNVLCADLDDCHPNNLGRYNEPLPSIILETSPERYQTIWLLTENLMPDELENINKRLSLAYADLGCDKSGWDIGQLLRIPKTINYKRDKPWKIKIKRTRRKLNPSLKAFSQLPDITESITEQGEPNWAETVFRTITPCGKRDATCIRLAGHLKSHGIASGEAFEILRLWAKDRCEQPEEDKFTDEDVRIKVRSSYSHDYRRKRTYHQPGEGIIAELGLRSNKR